MNRFIINKIIYLYYRWKLRKQWNEIFYSADKLFDELIKGIVKEIVKQDYIKESDKRIKATEKAEQPAGTMVSGGRLWAKE